MPYPYPQPQLDPALVEQILAMQQMDPQRAQITRQLKAAEMMRAGAANQMEGRTVGRKGSELYVAPNLLNAAASVYGNYRARKLEDDAALREQNMGVQKVDALRSFFAALSGGQRQKPLPYMGAEGE